MTEWTLAVGNGAQQWRTASPDRTVLAVVHTVATLRAVLDAVELLETDPRIQTIFTLAPDVLTRGRREELRRLDGLVVPWDQATRTSFDLVIAADSGHLYELDSPILKLPHGAMNNRVVPSSVGDPTSGLVVGLSRPWLTHYGRVVPASIAITHEEALRTIAEQCPEACSRTVLTGDLCLDRLIASGPRRATYRAALGVRDDRPVVAISSTWGRDSLYARGWSVVGDLLADLGGAHVRAVLHPAAWYTHGARQITAWADQERRHGLRWVRPTGWRGLVAAADVVIGDHGSAVVYAAAAGVPVLFVPPPAGVLRSGAAAATLGRLAPMLVFDRPITEQLEIACRRQESVTAVVTRLVSSVPGGAAGRLRSEMYRLLGMAEPARPAVARPVELPTSATSGDRS